MNIKEAIERGLYPKDEKGRALVPVGSHFNPSAIVIATDIPGGWPIVAYRVVGGAVTVCCWNENGVSAEYSMDLLPPPPRKVKVTRWALVSKTDPHFTTIHRTLTQTDRETSAAEFHIVELTGEYEQGWE